MWHITGPKKPQYLRIWMDFISVKQYQADFCYDLLNFLLALTFFDTMSIVWTKEISKVKTTRNLHHIYSCLCELEFSLNLSFFSLTDDYQGIVFKSSNSLQAKCKIISEEKKLFYLHNFSASILLLKLLSDFEVDSVGYGFSLEAHRPVISIPRNFWSTDMSDGGRQIPKSSSKSSNISPTVGLTNPAAFLAIQGTPIAER